jgi:predicted nucleotidyltransferase
MNNTQKGGHMISAGIIVEYNPFHNGHLYHLKQTRKKTNADVVIAVMSGQFLQRGEPALVSKWARTNMALKAGVDLVIELPYTFCTQKAEKFAEGAVYLLTSLQADFICFGSESGNIDTFTNTINFISNHESDYNRFIRQFMNEGVSYPKAASLAFQQLAPSRDLLDLSKPNNILGYHYVKALQEIGSKTVPMTIERIHAGYHDQQLSSAKISSATSIRKTLAENRTLDHIQSHIPDTTYQELSAFYQKYNTFAFWENFWPFLKYRFSHSEPNELKDIYEVEEGMEYRLIRFAQEATSFKDFMEMIKTKRYTWTRLQRACVHILTNTKKEKMRNKVPEYIRVLGFNQLGRQYLKEKKERISLPIISNLSQAERKAVQLDIKISQTYSFAFGNNGQKIIEEEKKQFPIIVE